MPDAAPGVPAHERHVFGPKRHRYCVAVFVINEGLAQKIWKIEFVGNEFLSERRLRTKIDSKPPTLMIFKGAATPSHVVNFSMA